MTSSQSAFIVTQLCRALSGDTENTNLTVVGFTRQGFEHMILHARCELVNHYTIETVNIKVNVWFLYLFV